MRHERNRITYACGHPGTTNIIADVWMRKYGATAICRDCLEENERKREAREGHVHTCVACPSLEPIISGCHCDNRGVYLICDFCKARDVEGRAKVAREVRP